MTANTVDNTNNFVLHGTVVYSEGPDKLKTYDRAYVVCREGVSEGVFEVLPEEYKSFPVTEAGDKLIIPGLIDLHIHAPQYQYRGNGMDMELLDWLETYTFPEERKYSDLSYAEKAYRLFVNDLKNGGTTRACIFATSHRKATIKLMELMEESGLVSYVGKVNMDRNVPDYYLEKTDESVNETEKWLEETEKAAFSRTGAIITPRFTPSCSRELMKALAGMAEKYGVPVQSHLSENVSEVKWVKELEPDTSCYADSYVKAGLMSEDIPCIMAHCVLSDEEERAILKEKGVFIAHSPESNFNICSGVAPVKEYLKEGLKVGLATDVAGGSSASMFDAVHNAIIASKMRYRLFDRETLPLSFAEAFYIATKGGGEFFGRAGSFEKGYSFDALILNERAIPTIRDDMSPEERAERFFYLGDERYITGKYVAGRRLI